MAFKKSGTSSKGTGKSNGKFNYRPRTTEEMTKRTHQSSTNREGFLLPELLAFTPADGENKIRILPPTWDDAGHYGMELWAHYGVGGDNSAYICRASSLKEACPICEARAELDDDGDTEGAKALVPRKRVAMWIINRNEEKKGPMIWFSPYTIDQEIAKQAIDEDGEVLPIDSPDEGYDVIFSRDNQGKNVPPKYTGVKLSRKSSPLFDDDDEKDKALEFILDHPLPECLVYHDYDTMAAAFAGKPSPKEESNKPERSATKPVFGKGKTKVEEEEEEEEESEEATEELPTWEEVHAMDEDEVTELAQTAEIDFSNEEFADLNEFHDWLCEQLGIEAPAKPKSKLNGSKSASATPSKKPSIGGKPTIGGKSAKTSPPPWQEKLNKFKATK